MRHEPEDLLVDALRRFRDDLPHLYDGLAVVLGGEPVAQWKAAWATWSSDAGDAEFLGEVIARLTQWWAEFVASRHEPAALGLGQVLDTLSEWWIASVLDEPDAPRVPYPDLVAVVTPWLERVSALCVEAAIGERR